MLEVLEVGWWAFGGGTEIDHLCEGQITKCRWFGILFYVRENLDGSMSFYISSNERMSHKGGNRGKGRPAAHLQILNLCTQFESDWEIAADVVRSLDPLYRPVRRHRCFTVRWAEAQLCKSRRSGCDRK